MIKKSDELDRLMDEWGRSQGETVANSQWQTRRREVLRELVRGLTEAQQRIMLFALIDGHNLVEALDIADSYPV